MPVIGVLVDLWIVFSHYDQRMLIRTSISSRGAARASAVDICMGALDGDTVAVQFLRPRGEIHGHCITHDPLTTAPKHESSAT